ncbi:serine hydrolase domain-containing protein [Streptococcus cuniculi]|uniref:Class A beta-lactamase-related serine hydrolase n=1 Tax=Streptococcus cuniculi TaxID=1432788 RepID=A0A4Y9JAH0_9STRE|nr:serine hydrolase domain-containing protein [Streptococcus cuniculi]MBF0778202.1 beta-lactamase family protein [Streptococcus cuniculi]TFU97942.1 class A beta-lactamase-related serine hydrolase [Streptococcus cuniculi]
MKAILEKIDQQIAEGLYRGASLALYHQGKWEEYYLGHSEEGIVTQAGLTYDLASVSKVVGVGTVLIFLLQEGILELDKPLVTYYPRFHDNSVTIRQLVTHTTGIDPYIPNRDSLDFAGLKEAIDQIRVTDDKDFHYTDINLILLGFMLEELLGQPLDVILQERIFIPWRMEETQFGPVSPAVPTVKGVQAGIVHDPKAKVLGVHCGSAGLFSTLEDLKVFLDHYLQEDFARHLAQNISSSQPRSIVWSLKDGGWLDHTGYTGPFLLVHPEKQLAAIFLTNRTYDGDDRPLWIEKRRELYQVIVTALESQA